MIDLGRAAAPATAAGTVIALVGGLGAGKTHWTKGLVAALGGRMDVTSPTFSLVNEYPGASLTVWHFDFYRLESSAEVLALGWDEYLDAGGVIVVEWADKFPELLPPDALWLRFRVEADASRTVSGIACPVCAYPASSETEGVPGTLDGAAGSLDNVVGEGARGECGSTHQQREQ